MKEIPLTKGKVALVDDEDYKWLSQYNWQARDNRAEGRLYYAQGRVNKKQTTMHQEIMKSYGTGLEVDHIDGNGLNNQRHNLRLVTRRTNQQNQHTNKSSQYPGVSYLKKRRKWQACYNLNGKTVFIGYFKTEEEAHIGHMEAMANVS